MICIECCEAMNHAHSKHESYIWCHTLILGIRTNDGGDTIILGFLSENKVPTADKAHL